MTVLSPPQPPIIRKALDLASDWCAGHTIDEAPALTHAIKVAATIGEHIPDAPAELIAAALLHDAPYFAPADVHLDAVLTTRLGFTVTRTVRAMEREHTTMDTSTEPHIDPTDLWALWAGVADKIVAISSILRRASRAEDELAFWAQRSAFVSRIGYFRAFCELACPHVPSTMRNELDHVVTRAERITGAYR
jgi:hypothetical protein